ncbi:hypothetical protein CEP51_013914 [Fusarium floridanum]|uniref:Uncharacterized protein n=1 Tax=Fusarium floridanum TaxID=1325733 RepID=A0A428Q2I7_9HYPO|nr:hypothetical protein CEP51_013914 [Fusarium floridanum]
MPDSIDLCQGSVPASSDGNLFTSAPRNGTYKEPGSNEQTKDGQTNDREPLPRPASPEQIQQSAELEPFIPSAKQTDSLSSTTRVSASTPPTLVPARARSLLKVWTLEAASLLLSFSLVVVVLAHFDQKGLPDWPLSITLNSFLAFFTTLIKATFMLPVSTAISQTKWSWFLQDRPIYDFHILDQASRGLRGSFMLLWRTRFKNFIALGAFIVITSTITSPITQLAISYPMRDREVPGGAYVRAVQKLETPGDYMTPTTMKAVQLAIASDLTGLNSSISPLQAFCSTGNCTFERYHTLGVCVKMANISSHLKIESFLDLESANVSVLYPDVLKESLQPPGSKIWKASLFDDFYLAHYDPTPLLTTMLNGNDTFGFRHDMNVLRSRIASFALIFKTLAYTDEGLTEDDVLSRTTGILRPANSSWYEAWEVLIHLCVQSYDTTVQAGADETRMVSSIALPVEPEDSVFVDIDCQYPWADSDRLCDGKADLRNNTLFLQGPAHDSPRPGSKPATFSANYFSLELVALKLRESLIGLVLTYYEDSDLSKPVTVTMTTSDVITNLWSYVLYNGQGLLNHTLRFNRLNNLYLNIATSLSSVMRREDLSYVQGVVNVTGKAWEAESYVQIRWGWLSFLAFELLLAATVLVLTIVAQKRNQKSDRESYDMICDLKDSSLAALVALDIESRSVMGDGLGPISGLEKTAKEVHVRLRGNRLVAVDATNEIRGDFA